MDHQKTGLFIAAMRRQKGWTQKELAERIGVTDKAVSRWETGKGMPDVSLLKPLSETLNVSLNELLSGEAIEPEHTLEKSDALVLRTIQEFGERIRRFRRNVLYALGVVLLAGSLLFLGFDVSFVAFYAALAGVFFLAAAVFLTFRGRPKKGLLAAALVLLLSFCLLEARDYVFVQCYRLPPQFNLQVVWGGNGIRYDKLFYDVYRYHVDTAEEVYEIVSHSKTKGWL